jgi:hypothetical protein
MADTSTSTPVPVAPPAGTDVKTDKPKMGGLSQLSKTDWSPWVGGKPKPDWSGLEGDPQSPTTPNQLRPISATASAKGYNIRKLGLATPFERKDNVHEFRRFVWDHFEDHGLDTITYLENLSDPGTMLSVVNDHSRFTVATAKQLSHAQAKLYDAYDKANDAAARKFLLASLSKELSSQIFERLDPNPTFPDVWLQFIKSIQSTSIERFASATPPRTPRSRTLTSPETQPLPTSRSFRILLIGTTLLLGMST